MDPHPLQSQHLLPDPGQLPLHLVRGGWYAPASSGRAVSGSGNARRSTLPLGVSGIPGRQAIVAGTMYSGHPLTQYVRNCGPRRRSGRAGPAS